MRIPAAPNKATAVALLSVTAAAAQVPPGASPPLHTTTLDALPGGQSASGIRWQLGRDAMARGQHEAALSHLLAALEFHPDSPAILLDIALACRELSGGDDPTALWLERFVRAAADHNGRFRADPEQRRRLGKLDVESSRKLGRQRALAAAELQRAITRLAARPKLGDGVTARWLTELFVELAYDAPALLREHGPALREALDRFVPDYDAVCQGLLQLTRRPRGQTAGAESDAASPDEIARRRRLELGLQAARILAGLARQ